jgi:hypothetical protein
MSIVAKPTLNKAAAALAFAESKPAPAVSAASQKTSAEKRVFHAPEGHRRLTINLPEEVHKKLRLQAVEADTTVTDIIVRLVTKELDK